MIEHNWTPKLIAERLEEAVDVLARLPDEGARGLYDLWPRMVGDPCPDSRPAAAEPAAIDRMDEALQWLFWLEPRERVLVWLRAEGLPWKRITHRLGVSRTTAWQQWTIALLKIATRLDAADEQNRPDMKVVNRLDHSVLRTR